jgi:hypothetical protein
LKSLSLKRFLFIIAISGIAAALLCEKKGDAWEEKVRNGLYALSGDSVPDFDAVMLDNHGIPFVMYATENGITAGKQYNATIVANYALDYFDKFKKANDTLARNRFLHCAHWLLTSISQKDGYALYEFNWQQPWYDSVKTPFTSGMTSGLAMEVFAKANRVVNDTLWTNAVQQLLKGYEVPVNEGGFTYKEASGYWYEEIADSNMHTPRIFDGHIFALLGVKYIADSLNVSLAEGLYLQGLQSLKFYLPQYDAGKGVIYYDRYKKIADKKYQRLLVSQMNQLWEATGDSVFLSYHKKWKAPMERPYVQRIVVEKNRSGLILFGLLMIGFGLLLFFISGIFFKRHKH